MSESLRDQLSQAFDSVTTRDEPAPEAPAPVEVTQEAASPVETTTPEKQGRTAGRERDEKGRLLPGKREAAPQAPQATQAPKAPPAPQVAPEAPKPRPSRPSTWKKDYWEAFDKLATENPSLADYINQRESEYAKGVSTYKQEWDRAKPLLEAIAPYQQEIAQSGMPAEQHFQRLFNAHLTLARGTPEQRLQMFTRLAHDYQVPLQNLLSQGADGSWQLNQPQPQQQPAFDPSQIQSLVDRRVQESLQKQSTEQEIKSFMAQKDKYPHFEEVRETMAGLLQANLAQGLEDAYEAALKHPRHSQLYEAMQQQQRQQEEAKAAEERRKATESARRKAVSPRTATPTSALHKGDGKGLRATIEDAFDQVASRV